MADQGMGMYSHVFSFQFAEDVSLAGRTRFLSELFQTPEQTDAGTSALYWLKMNIRGGVEFYSSCPSVTEMIRQRLGEAEVCGMLTVHSPGLSSGLTFLSRMITSLWSGAVAQVKSDRRPRS